MVWKVVSALSLLLTWSSALAQEEPPGPPWKNQIGLPDEPFQSWTAPPYVKFTIITKPLFDPNVVYFQDSARYEFHFAFALECLEPFLGMTIEQFDAVTLHAANQQAVLGAVILPPWHDPPFQEYGIQLARNDPYTREETVRFFHLVKAAVIADPNVKAFYFPTYEQYPVTEQNRQWFEGQGIPVGSTAQWAEGNASYSEGWALGRLVFVPGSEIQPAYAAGELLPDDILLTDGVPAEVPSVAGIVSLAPSTPNSHVAILSRSQGVPFVYLAQGPEAAKTLVGHTVYFAVTKDAYSSSCTVKLFDIGFLSEAERSSLLALKKAPPLVIRPLVSPGRLWADTNDLHSADIGSFGGKASNYGVLCRAIPDSSQPALAFSFDLWTGFLDQPLPTAYPGGTLRAEIARRLAKYPTYPPADMQALFADLAAIRDLFKDTDATRFSQAGPGVINALREFGFAPSRNLRFRSSTNVEDSEQFTGAGLYDSFSGCLADDLDNDTAGPCVCDPAETSERGVFRAIRKVFASFYNDNAYLERLKHKIDEAQVGMALLVHYSFPDDIELANGVATMEKTRGSGWSVSVVSQKGAVSVTNPPMDAVPEEVRIDAGFQEPSVWVVRRSSLVSLREDTVLQWDAEYLQLYELLVASAERYCEETQKDDIVLDLEFKKTTPEGKLLLKQIREIPRPGAAQCTTPFLLAQSKQYRTLQGRGSNVLTNHRLKSLWTLRPKSLWLSEENLKNCIYGEAIVEYAADGQIRHETRELPLLAGAKHVYEPPQGEFDRYDLMDSWQFPDLCNPRTYRLRTMPLYQATLPDPVVTLGDFRLGVEVEYQRPVPLDSEQTTTVEEAALYEPWQPTDQDAPEECSFSDPNLGVSINTRFYSRWGWGWDAPTCLQFEQTRIEGLTAEPIVLTGYFSQSVGGGAHLCPKNFLFEPGLEPGIPQKTLDELRAKNIRLIYYTTGARECRPTEWQDTPPLVRFYGFDESIECPH
ncbi:MAG: hypothetical protein NTZ17_09815 [Phycisphaerae bacterium]|nr:hypothetical protein [Phycisphaerae bacterium]